MFHVDLPTDTQVTSELSLLDYFSFIKR